MGQSRYACLLCGTWTCSACSWQRAGASVTYPFHTCARCGGRSGEIVPTMHTEKVWRMHNEGEQLPPAGARPAPEPQVSERAPEVYRGVPVPKQGPHQRLDLASWKRGVDDCLKRQPFSSE